jgi:hypothetical protein
LKAGYTELSKKGFQDDGESIAYFDGFGRGLGENG